MLYNSSVYMRASAKYYFALRLSYNQYNEISLKKYYL